MAAEYEYRVVEFSRDQARDAVRQSLTEAAEYEHWELHRTRISFGGRRRAWLRRKIIRVPRGGRPD